MNYLSEIQYFGCVCLYHNLAGSKHVFFEQYENFQKMSYRNRCQVSGPIKVIDLTVPLIGGRDQKTLITEIKVDNASRWQRQHWRTIESCYNKSPFFFYYKDSLEALLFKQYEFLWDLDMATIHWVLGNLKLELQVGHSTHFQKQPGPEIIDIRGKFRPANRQLQSLPKYQQVFNTHFESNLCILDLIFNLGPHAVEYLFKQDKTVINYH